jgi:hypothetical protein
MRIHHLWKVIIPLMILLFLTGINSSFNPETLLPSKSPEIDWYYLLDIFHQLKRLDPGSRKRLAKMPFFERKMKKFQKQTRKFFLTKTIEAFTALEGESNDTGLVVFFIRAMSLSILYDLRVYPDVLFSFDKIFSEKSIDLEMYLTMTFKCFSFDIKHHKTNDGLKIILRIFEKLKRKLKGTYTIGPLWRSIKEWEYEVFMLDMKLNDTINSEIIKLEKEIPQKDLIDCFNQLRILFRAKSPSNTLITLFCDQFDHLAFRFAMDYGDFSFLLNQPIELAIILVNYICEIYAKEEIQSNFNTLFKVPNESLGEIGTLYSAAEKKLSDMVRYLKGECEDPRSKFDFWKELNSRIMDNSIEKILQVSKKISFYHSRLTQSRINYFFLSF